MKCEQDTALLFNRRYKRNFVVWFYGLLSGSIGGFAAAIDSALIIAFVAPETFNFQHLGKLLSAALAIGFFQGIKVGVAYVAKSPLPPLSIDTAPPTQPTLG